PELNGAKRWIFIPGLGNFQPSEVAKFAVIVLFANIIAVNADKMKTFSYGVLPFGIVLGAVAVLMLLEPHLSGTILICSIGAVMMFIGGTSLKWFGIGGAIGAGGITAAVLAFPDLVPYAMTRIEMWQNPFMDIQGKGHQTVQSLYAIGSGGLFGLGLGNSRQKHMYVPEPQNDFIFSIICEELGFVGAMLVVLLFVALLIRGATIAIYAKDKFGAMLVVGITAQVTIQAMLNIAVVTNTIPNTGISLPFFSYGGTSLLMLLGEMGIVLSVSRQCRYPKE
ncbi:MAG: FtsW/RodA/SpoVE family cell cycle protein, partial [Pygmaiobacter massiliensis]